jgi:hypothetical protein
MRKKVWNSKKGYKNVTIFLLVYWQGRSRICIRIEVNCRCRIKCLEWSGRGSERGGGRRLPHLETGAGTPGWSRAAQNTSQIWPGRPFFNVREPTRLKDKMVHLTQCWGSGSGRIRVILPDPKFLLLIKSIYFLKVTVRYGNHTPQC